MRVSGYARVRVCVCTTGCVPAFAGMQTFERWHGLVAKLVSSSTFCFLDGLPSKGEPSTCGTIVQSHMREFDDAL